MKTFRRVIGLTGGIASGKSTVLELFQKQGIPTLSADLLAHECVQPGKPAYHAVLRHFGTHFRLPDGSLDREKLGRHVFANASERRKLERLIHPCVIQEIKTFIRQHSGFMMVDIPLLYEAKLVSLVDEVVVVYATQAQQIARLTSRNGYSKVEALRRIRSQWPLRQKCQLANTVLNNTTSLQQLKKNVNAYLQNILTR